MSREMLCTEDHLICDAFGTVMRLKAGRVYTVSRNERRGMVTVFCEPMVMAPARLFKRRRGGYSRNPVAESMRRWRLTGSAA